MALLADRRAGQSIRFPDQALPSAGDVTETQASETVRNVDTERTVSEGGSRLGGQLRVANDDFQSRQSVQIPCGAVGFIFAGADAIAIVAASLFG
ncbi:hypothetical protein PCS76_22875, partial [Acinetobacter baumannii]|nr:hypothetical protein [Acinetobacter baumannii]